MEKSVHTRYVTLLLFGFALSGFAVDSAFWKPSTPDPKTWFFQNFDAGTGAGVDEHGRFGNAWRGPGAVVQPAAETYLSGSVAMEAWVKLETLPEQRAHVFLRKPAAETTRGFELFIEPNGSLGLSVTNTLGTRSELVSGPGVVTTGGWQHLAGISTDANALYVDGHKIAWELHGSGKGLGADRRQETLASPVSVGGGLNGWVDEARIHSALVKLWPEPENPWIAEVAKSGLPAAENVFLPGRAPVLYLDLEGSFEARAGAATVKVSGDGEFVDGVRGKAFSGKLGIAGPLTSAKEGTLEFWSRPRGYSNWTDQNRSIVNANLFGFYFWNSSHGLRPVTFYYYSAADGKRQLHVASDSLGTEVYSGQWYHYVITWGNGRTSWYVNGKKAGTTGAGFQGEMLNSLTFGGQGFGDVDEFYAYNTALTETEAANTYWRYVDPAKLVTPREKVADLKFWHLPSSRTLYVQISPDDGTDPAQPVEIRIKDLQGEIVWREAARFDEGFQEFTLPELDGEFRISAKVGEKESPPQVFLRHRFAWENHSLGVTDRVYAPFTPVQVNGSTVSVVGRDYVMNGFGLWDSVSSFGRDILAGPVRLVAVDGQGVELAWQGKLSSASADPGLAVIRSTSVSAAVRTETTSEIEPDGMMKVTLKLLPVANPVELQRLSLEIPLQAAVAELMQEVGMHCRSGYTGAIPDGDGEVWTSKQTLLDVAWLNAFTSYIWLGGAERGLCWFAENDKGWITAKNHDQPLLRISRGKSAVTLRVDLVNIPGIIAAPTELVFGLQVSPTKPLPADYRSKARTLPGVGLPVHPWGGLSCSWKSPWQDRWDVVDKVIEARNGGKADVEWFRAFARDNDPPKVHGIKDWVGDVMMFASRGTPLSSPDPVYFEEMHVLPVIAEYHVFQDEWSQSRLPAKQYQSMEIYRDTGGREINPNTDTNFCKSYQDYALALMNEWWKRGVSIYWDNTYPNQSVNLWTSAAYTTGDGRIQPARIYWNQREYMKRTWNLMNYWREKGVPRPLEFVCHMTNCNVLPFFSWATCNYDMELSQSVYAKTHPDHYTPGEPFTPDYLRATSIGRQVGNYPYLVHDLFQSALPGEAWGLGIEKIERERRSWGMRTVHEIIAGGPQTFGPLSKAIYQFGYDSGSVQVWNYWSEQPAFTVDDKRVKGLLLTRAADKKMLLVLQSWSEAPVGAQVRFDTARIGFAPGTTAREGLNNRHRPLNGNGLDVEFDFPYETAVFLIDSHAPEEHVLFADNFDDWCSPGWDYVPIFAGFDRGRLRLGRNETSWMGHPRLFKYLNLPDFKEGELAFTFQIEQIPAAGAKVLSAGFGNGVALSKHGLTHSYLSTDVDFLVTADPVKGWVWSASTRRSGKMQSFAAAPAGTVDTQPHQVRIEHSAAGAYTLSMDGQKVLEFTDPDANIHNGFAITALDDPAKTIGALLLDDILLSSSQADYTALEMQRQTAKARSREIVAARIDELKRQIIAAFGIFDHQPVYNLAMFRQPVADVEELAQRVRSEPDRGRRLVLLAVLRELPKRQQEHVDSMKAIGQPAHRLEEFKKARISALAFLAQTPTADGGAAEAVAETIKALSTESNE